MATVPLFASVGGDLPAFEQQRGGVRRWTDETAADVRRVSRRPSIAESSDVGELTDTDALRVASLMGLGRSGPLDKHTVVVQGDEVGARVERGGRRGGRALLAHLLVVHTPPTRTQAILLIRLHSLC